MERPLEDRRDAAKRSEIIEQVVNEHKSRSLHCYLLFMLGNSFIKMNMLLEQPFFRRQQDLFLPKCMLYLIFLSSWNTHEEQTKMEDGRCRGREDTPVFAMTLKASRHIFEIVLTYLLIFTSLWSSLVSRKQLYKQVFKHNIQQAFNANGINCCN